MTTLTLAKLVEIEAAAAKATPGPWRRRGWALIPAFKDLRGPSFKVSVVMFATDLTEADYQARNADLHHIALCDPATVAALVRIVKAAAAYVDEQDDDLNQYMTLKQLLRDAGLLE
ncbi:MAG: hypothetical protein IPN24_11260 [Betaproteobacteria bacterium]|nr:hypothetical protein [Betaproteobacteria bacterium]